MASYRGVEDVSPRRDPALVKGGQASSEGAQGSSQYPMSINYGGEGVEAQDYEASQPPGVTVYLEATESYGKDTVSPVGDDEDGGIHAPSSSVMYDYGTDYAANQPMAVPRYDMGLVDAYDQSPAGNQMTPAMTNNMSGGMPGAMYPSMANGEAAMDPMNAQYWYGSNSIEQPMVSPSCDVTMFHKPMTTRYDNYRYAYPSYYPQNGQSYSPYGSDQTLPYPGNYGMQEEAYSPGKQPFSPRRAVSTGALPAPSKTSPMNSYQVSPDRAAMRGWNTQGYSESMDQNTMQNIPMINQPTPEQQSMQMPARFGPDAFYGELSKRLQQEMKTKRQGSCGRPRSTRHNYVCAMCNARTTPQWRYIKGTSVCNACYMRIRKQKLKQKALEKEEGYIFESDSSEVQTPSDGRMSNSAGAPRGRRTAHG
ncbi:GATA zinc finger domain-containing protein [Babesia ovata]|uniref:GATA zinc finger domain-containing protein n=1 Tax=Babesia ovata TaxID=189622 RepID=A0A2H6K759_9APIC|nr:GATA zinc finger domain-containing protein [Babesia ovata]GBE58825.1 GATA zinc finger domain-containing protein [Babesia ovata]